MNANASWNESNFDEMCWHDNHVHGLRIRAGEHGCGELELDIDYILEWLRPTETTFAFRLAPATLTFLDVFGLRIEVDYATIGAGMTPFSISGIERDDPTDYGAWKWTIRLNWPDGLIVFSARGFTQALRAEPVISGAQCLNSDQRRSKV